MGLPYLVRLVDTGDHSPQGPRQLLSGIVVDDIELTAGDRREHRGWQQHLSGDQEHLSGTTGGHDEGEQATNKWWWNTGWLKWPSRYLHRNKCLIRDCFRMRSHNADWAGGRLMRALAFAVLLMLQTGCGCFSGEKYRLSTKGSPKRTKWKTLRLKM